jgi:hypothetical protein
MAARTEFQKSVMAQYDQINNPRTAKADGSVEVKESYFYTFGKSAEDWAEKVQAELRAAGIKCMVTAEDRFANWPKTSYWVAIVRPA